MDWLEDLRESVRQYGTAPSLADMPRLTLADKGIAGPTSAHRIEEVHTPLNLGFITVTTGSTAFQNIVGVTAAELGDRAAAGREALRLCGLSPGDAMLVTYPPLVNVFPRAALEEAGIRWQFLESSSRDALVLALCEWQADAKERGPLRAVLGESSFLRATLESAKRMGLLPHLPRGLVLLAAGTPLDADLLSAAAGIDAAVHDLYGCQEFGWLTLDGVPLRGDIALLPSPQEGLFDLMVGGLPTGDCFPVLPSGHLCDPRGSIITYARRRTAPERETTVLETTAASLETVERLSRTILRLKAKIVRVAPDCATGAPQTVLRVSAHGGAAGEGDVLTGPAATRMFDSLLEAQMQYQAMAKNDPVWNKRR